MSKSEHHPNPKEHRQIVDNVLEQDGATNKLGIQHSFGRPRSIHFCQQHDGSKKSNSAKEKEKCVSHIDPILDCGIA